MEEAEKNIKIFANQSTLKQLYSVAKIVPEVSAKVETYDLTDKEESESSLANQLAVSDLVAQYL